MALQTDRRAADAAGERLRPRSTGCIQFAQLSHRLLHDLATMARGPHELPIHVRLAVLLAGRVAQVHW
jgi:hypothetical protein